MSDESWTPLDFLDGAAKVRLVHGMTVPKPPTEVLPQIWPFNADLSVSAIRVCPQFCLG
jgi:hypothetical protein